MQNNSNSIQMTSTSSSSSSSTTSLSSEADIKNRRGSSKKLSDNSSSSTTNSNTDSSSCDSSSTISRSKSAAYLHPKTKHVQATTKYKKNYAHHVKSNHFKALNRYTYSNSTDSIYNNTNSNNNNNNNNKDPFRKAPFPNNALSKSNSAFASTNLLLFSNVSTTAAFDEASTNKILHTSNFSAFRPYKKPNDIQPLAVPQPLPVDPFLSAPFEPAKSSSSSLSSASTNPFMNAPFLGSKKPSKKSSKLNSSTKSDITYQRIDLNKEDEEDNLDINAMGTEDVNVLRVTKKYKSLSDNLFSSLDVFSSKKSPLVDTSND
jgi:hypothetical protein